MVNYSNNLLNRPMPSPSLLQADSVWCDLYRLAGCRLSLVATLSGNNESVTTNIFKVTGSIMISSAYAEISRIGTMTNLTGLYFDLWDGTNAVDITASGATLSAFTVGSLILKDKVATEVVTIVDASQCRVTEPAADKRQHQPFLVTQKTSTDTYIRFHYSTTDTPVDADFSMYVTYLPIDSGLLEAV